MEWLTRVRLPTANPPNTYLQGRVLRYPTYIPLEVDVSVVVSDTIIFFWHHVRPQMSMASKVPNSGV